MATSKDREQLHTLNGYTAPPLWKHEPTPIKPRDRAPGTYESGSNPFGQNPNRNKVLVGNITSTRVLSRSNDPPPRKKVKTEHAHLHTASGSTYTQHGDRNNTRSNRSHESLITPEAIDVDDSSVILDNNSHTNSGNSSTDELNIRSLSTEGTVPSIYKFGTPSHGSTVRNNNPPIVSDGPHTEWLKKKHSPSQVKEKIAKIEAKTQREDRPNRIDLRKTLKTKDRMKTKDKKGKSFPLQQPSQEQPSRAPAMKCVFLPLKELYLDETYHNSENQKLEIYWRPGDKITIKSNKRPIFGPTDIRVHAHTLLFHVPPDSPIDHDPVFQLNFSPIGAKSSYIEQVTAKLDCSSPGAEESYYRDLLDWLKTRVNDKETLRASDRDKLWDGVDWRKGMRSAKQGKSSRQDELLQGEQQRALRQLNVRSIPAAPQKRSASQSSLRITPPSPSSITISGNQKSKQRSRQSTSDLPVVPRRSTRNMSGATRSPALDSDEVILVYPPGVPGAVNITNGDYLRLQPGEFLNDTLIEFGLKLWLKELEQSDAMLASQIHVFNSFFYKKLNHHQKGSPNLGYDSVRKWTSKFDIFQKKYIIVPINEHLHWYFAIICDPEYVLVPSASNVTSASTRRQTRQSISEAMIVDEPDETPTASKPVSASVSENDRDEDKFPSEAEVEDTLQGFVGSCTISNSELDEDVAGADGARSPSALSYVSDDGVLSANLQTDNLDGPVSEILPVDTARFYQHAPPKRDKGKRKADIEPESSVMEIDDDNDDNGGSALNDTPKTFIFTFDSLGGRHPQAIRKLTTYLKMEASDKKKVENTGDVSSKAVPVPAQPNFCDCGIYLLHLAQTFMSNPVHYRRMILAQKKGVPPEERKAAWNDDQVSDKREDLRARIMNLSGEWKKERAAKEEAKHQETSNSHTVEVESDGEIDILEPTPSTSKAKYGGRTRQAANRLRG